MKKDTKKIYGGRGARYVYDCRYACCFSSQLTPSWGCIFPHRRYIGNPELEVCPAFHVLGSVYRS